MVLQAPDQQLVTATVDFCEYYTPGMEMILGLPDILDYYLGVSVTVLQIGKAIEVNQRRSWSSTSWCRTDANSERCYSIGQYYE